jgi:hypothetical protein
MDAMAQAIEGWHDFYLMIGTAAATLVGLLFVALSLNVDVIARQENADLQALAGQAFTSFIDLAIFAVLFLIPDQGRLGLGLPLIGVGGYGLYLTLGRFLKSRHMPQRRLGSGRSIAGRFIVPAVCFATLMIIAVSVLFGSTAGLYWLVPVMILLVVGASRNAWDLLMGLRQSLTT